MVTDDGSAIVTVTLPREQLRQMRTHNQLLSDSERSSAAGDIIRRLCALQSQEWPSAQLAIHARTTGLTQADVIRAREVERAFVLTWTLRGTLHLVAAEAVRWQLAVGSAAAIGATRRRYQQLGLSETVRERALPEIKRILSVEGALQRADLAAALGERGIPVAGQAIHHLLRFAALRGLICLGPEVDGVLTYVLLDSWLPATTVNHSARDPLRELALRYLRAYAPATEADFARWTGLKKADVRAAWAAIADDCFALGTPSGDALVLEEQRASLDTAAKARTVRLLPRYDNYLLGYTSRDFVVAPAHAKQVHPGGGLIRACVIVDGEAKANWKMEKRRTGMRLRVTPFVPLDGLTVEMLEREAESLGEFFNTIVELRMEDA